MSIVVNIKQNQKELKKIDLAMLKRWLSKEKLSFGVLNVAFASDEYEGKNDIRGVSFVIYDPQIIGRGIGFFLEQNYDLELTVNYFNSEHDIQLFYQLIEKFCDWLHVTEFLHENKFYSIDNLEELETEAINTNQGLLKNDLVCGLTVFGAIYPINIEASFLMSVKQLDEQEIAKRYQQYLNEKQQDDYYYAKAIIYEKKGQIFGSYVLTVGVPSIIPLRPYIPFGYQYSKDTTVQKWNIQFIVTPEFKRIGEISFDQLSEIFELENCPKFDEEHVIITLSKKQIEQIKKRNKLKFESYIKEILPAHIETVWNIITNNEDYSWRSDISKVKIINKKKFIEYDKHNFNTNFIIMKKEEMKEYRLDFDNQNLYGHWIGRIKTVNEQDTEIEVIEKINVKQKWKKILAKKMIKMKQKQYIKDLKKKINQKK